MQNSSDYKTVTQLASCGRYPFTVGQLKYFLLFRDRNGLTNATFKIGKRLYIRTDLFDEWIENHREIG